MVLPGVCLNKPACRYRHNEGWKIAMHFRVRCKPEGIRLGNFRFRGLSSGKMTYTNDFNQEMIPKESSVPGRSQGPIIPLKLKSP